MRIGVYGLGAIGSVIASRIYENFKEYIYILSDENRFEKLQKGFIVNGVEYKIKVTKDEKMDYIFVCVKNYDLNNSLSTIKEFVNDNTIIIPLLNGIIAVDVIKQFFPKNKVLYGIIKVEASRNINNEVSYKGVKALFIGNEFNFEVDKDVSTIIDILVKSDLKAVVSEDMKRTMWLKWMLNMGINQVSALTHSTYKEMQHPNLQNLLYQLFLEVANLGKAMGINISEVDALNTLNDTLGFNSSNYTSLAQDVYAKRKTEIEYFGKMVLDLGKKYKVSTPANEFMYNCLKAIEDNYLASKNE